MTLTSSITFRFFHIFYFFYHLISLFHQRRSVIFLAYWFIWLNRYIFAGRLSGSFVFTSMRSKFRPLWRRLYRFWCWKRCSGSFIIIRAYVWDIFLYLIRGVFNHTTFCRNVINSFRFSKGCFDKILHGFFIFLHIWLTQSHLFWHGFCEILIRRFSKMTGLSCVRMMICGWILGIYCCLWLTSLKLLFLMSTFR